MMTDKQPTCAERIGEEMTGRIAQYTFDADCADLAACKDKLEWYGRDVPDDRIHSGKLLGLFSFLCNADYDGGAGGVDDLLDAHTLEKFRYNDFLNWAVDMLSAGHTVCEGLDEEALRAAIIEGINEEEIEGLDAWREAAREADYEGGHESVLAVDKHVRWTDDDGDEHSEMCDFTDEDEFAEFIDDNDLYDAEVQKVYRVCLSFGGPADYFDFVVDDDGDVCEVWYVFQDWFDGARRKVDSSLNEELAQKFCIEGNY